MTSPDRRRSELATPRHGWDHPWPNLFEPLVDKIDVMAADHAALRARQKLRGRRMFAVDSDSRRPFGPMAVRAGCNETAGTPLITAMEYHLLPTDALQLA